MFHTSDPRITSIQRTEFTSVRSPVGDGIGVPRLQCVGRSLQSVQLVEEQHVESNQHHQTDKEGRETVRNERQNANKEISPQILGFYRNSALFHDRFYCRKIPPRDKKVIFVNDYRKRWCNSSKMTQRLHKLTPGTRRPASLFSPHPFDQID